MTCPHLKFDIIYKSSKSSLIASVAYNCRRSIYDETEHCTKKSRSKVNDYISDEMLLPPGAPQQYKNVKRIMNDIQKIEKDKLAYKMIIPFQWELSYEQNIALIKDFLNQEFVSNRHPVHLTLHGVKNTEKCHAHVIVIDRQLDKKGQWETRKSKTKYYKRGTVKKLDEHGRVINPDAETLTEENKIDTPKLKNKRLQYDSNNDVIMTKGWQELQYDDNHKPLLDANGYPILIDIREPDYDPVTGKQKYSQNGKYKKLQWKKTTEKHSHISDCGNIKHLRKVWETLQNNAYAKYGITDENGEILKVDLRSYREQNKERPEDEHLIPTLHIGYRKKKDKASQEEVHEIIRYNENAKKNNEDIKLLKLQKRQRRNLQKQLQTTENAIAAEDRDDIKYVNDLNIRKTFITDYTSDYNKMLRRKKLLDAAILRQMENNINLNDAETRKIDRNTKRGKASYTRLRRHKALLTSMHQKLSQVTNTSLNIKSAAEQYFDRLNNNNIVSYVASRFGENAADITANVLERIQQDKSNPFDYNAKASPFYPRKDMYKKVLEKASTAITKNPDIEDAKKNALSDWKQKPGEAPPASVLQIIDTYHTATNFYPLTLNDKKWTRTVFSAENPEQINQDYQHDLEKIANEEKRKAESAAARQEQDKKPVWRQEEQDRLNAIREMHYENLVNAAQPYIADDLHKIQRTKALKIMRNMLFEDKDRLFKLYDDAAAAAKEYYKLKPVQSQSAGKTKQSTQTANLTPDRSSTRANDNARK